MPEPEEELDEELPGLPEPEEELDEELPGLPEPEEELDEELLEARHKACVHPELLLAGQHTMGSPSVHSGIIGLFVGHKATAPLAHLQVPLDELLDEEDDGHAASTHPEELLASQQIIG